MSANDFLKFNFAAELGLSIKCAAIRCRIKISMYSDDTPLSGSIMIIHRWHQSKVIELLKNILQCIHDYDITTTYSAAKRGNNVTTLHIKQLSEFVTNE